MSIDFRDLSRRALIARMASVAAVLIGTRSFADVRPAITVWKDPNCGCCAGWIDHLRRNGFSATVVETTDVQTVKTRRQVPADLASCHTAEIAGYTIEGHVPASAIQRLLAEKPAARGLAVPGMPIGSPGMEGGTPEPYDVILFGDRPAQVFESYIGVKPA